MLRSFILRDLSAMQGLGFRACFLEHRMFECLGLTSLIPITCDTCKRVTGTINIWSASTDKPMYMYMHIYIYV